MESVVQIFDCELVISGDCLECECLFACSDPQLVHATLRLAEQFVGMFVLVEFLDEELTGPLTGGVDGVDTLALQLGHAERVSVQLAILNVNYVWTFV